MLESATILVTGGAGYIGSHVVHALVDRGVNVVVLDNLSTGFRRALPDGVTFYEMDCGDQDAVIRIMQEHDVRAVAHFAGSIIVSESVERPLAYYRNNTCTSLNLITAAVAANVPHMLFSSTAAVYGLGDGSASPISEDAPKQPINPYGMSKLMTEAMLRDTVAAHPLNCGILRYFNVAGADPNGRTGQATVGATHLIKVAVEAALGKRDGITVFGSDYNTPDGTGVRDYIHVSDLANAHVLALLQLMEAPTSSFTVNCGYGRGYSVLEVIRAVERVSRIDLQVRMQDRRAGDPDSLIADNARISSLLHWKPDYADLDRIVEHALTWEKSMS